MIETGRDFLLPHEYPDFTPGKWFWESVAWPWYSVERLSWRLGEDEGKRAKALGFLR